MSSNELLFRLYPICPECIRAHPNPATQNSAYYPLAAYLLCPPLSHCQSLFHSFIQSVYLCFSSSAESEEDVVEVVPRGLHAAHHVLIEQLQEHCNGGGNQQSQAARKGGRGDEQFAMLVGRGWWAN